MPGPSALQRLVAILRRALLALDCEVPDRVIETWAIEIHLAMSSGGRTFHTIEHVFALIGGADPIQILAALFHDTVYLQVDGGLPRGLEHRLGDVMNDRLHFAHDLMASRVAGIFGFRDGQRYDEIHGLNEYLSALLAARSLAGHVPEQVIWQVVACIELTIPFRGREGGRTAAEALAMRLGETVVMPPVLIERTVVLAQDLANRDVANFASPDPVFFLDNTWNLLPESNAQLRASVYTVGEYARAMEGMRGFFTRLDPARVFESYAGTPDRETLDQLRQAAALNIGIAKRYLDAKALAASLLYALAIRTGGDAPVSLFMGDLPSVNPDTPLIENYLPSYEPPDDVDPVVYRLLDQGRTRDQGFDMKHSPLAAFVYASMGSRLHALVDELMRHPFDERPDFLWAQACAVLIPVCRAAAELAVTRRDQLLAFSA